ncbi:acyl-CoA dehydrogenase family protein [Kineobactrum salinum]|uniref:Acyl-CoA/acyl-ACP dehydrogenase n=1 Tax=Kineobactrum salinum TaxID=2708301 RepID=A0A6C0TZH7_9GAMM|nr:acyl-CoA dehydrogenase family protein [Kineobactrum salinum]QIB65058.1 acyl-CoA/acyl-ACP dehydrogenase [Kineobactrum salinum]
MMFDAVARVFRDICSPNAIRRGSAGEWLADEWRNVIDLGLTNSMVDEDVGGLGMRPREIGDILRLVGYWAPPLPIGENVLATAVLSRAGLDIPDGVISIAPPAEMSLALTPHQADWSISGKAHGVPWARYSDAVVVQLIDEDRRYIAAVPQSGCSVTPGDNLAGEPRDDVVIDCVLPQSCVAETSLKRFDVNALGAALRTVMLAGAAERILEMSLAFASEHEQFGRPIAAFQAVQHNLAVMGEQVAICRGAANIASDAMFVPGGDLAIAVSKAQAGEAGTKLCSLAHQVHGAMGFSEEYDLHLYTKRIWAWREEFGSESFWNRRVGDAALAHDSDLWSLISSELRSTDSIYDTQAGESL